MNSNNKRSLLQCGSFTNHFRSLVKTSGNLETKRKAVTHSL